MAATKGGDATATGGGDATRGVTDGGLDLVWCRGAVPRRFRRLGDSGVTSLDRFAVRRGFGEGSLDASGDTAAGAAASVSSSGVLAGFSLASGAALVVLPLLPLASKWGGAAERSTRLRVLCFASCGGATAAAATGVAGLAAVFGVLGTIRAPDRCAAARFSRQSFVGV